MTVGEPSLTTLVRRALAEADRWEVHALMRRCGWNPAEHPEVKIMARTLRYLRSRGEVSFRDPAKLSTVVVVGPP